MVVNEEASILIPLFELVKRIFAGKLIQAELVELLLRFEAKLARPEDQCVDFLVADPAALLLIVLRRDHAPLARPRHLSLVPQVACEDQHLACIVLNTLSIVLPTLVLQHIFQVELLADL